MLHSKMYISSFIKILTPLLLSGLFFEECQTKESYVNTETNICNTVADIEGEYSCTGECIVIGDEGEKTVVTVTGEIDRIERFPGAKENLYQINITGSNDFHEIELGALADFTLRTATAEVTDSQYPVLEEYIFQTDQDCKAVSYTKIVRNPDPKIFKTCVIYCMKKSQ